MRGWGSHRVNSVTALVAVLLAACSSSSTPPSHDALPTCTFNIGGTVQPAGSVGARVPEPGGLVSGYGDKASGGGSSIQIDTSKDGVVTITISKNGVDSPAKVCQSPRTWHYSDTRLHWGLDAPQAAWQMIGTIREEPAGRSPSVSSTSATT